MRSVGLFVALIALVALALPAAGQSPSISPQRSPGPSRAPVQLPPTTWTEADVPDALIGHDPFLVYLMMQCQTRADGVDAETTVVTDLSDGDFCLWVVSEFLAPDLGFTWDKPSEVEPTPESTATPKPGAWTRKGAFEYRWQTPPAPDFSLQDYPMQVRSDRGCRYGVTATIDTESDTEGEQRKGRIRPHQAVTVTFTSFLDDDYFDEWTPADSSVTAIRCLRGPWVRTYRGGGSDDRFVTIPANEEIQGRFTVRADLSFGCTTGVYIDDESVDEFDLFFDGRQTKTRTADIVAEGRTHLKVISSCPWTLRLTGQVE